MRLEGKRVLITGASSGIGRALAVEYARRGARLVLAARRTDRLAEVAREVEAAGGEAVPVPCDVTRDADVLAAFGAARERFEGLDVAVANAGFGVAGRVDGLALDDFRRQMETNVFGLLRTVLAALPELERTRGSLALLGSVSGHVALPGIAPYSMSKYAVRALAETLWLEMRPKGVSVTLVSPGFVESEIRLVDDRGRLVEGAEDPVPRWLVMPVGTAARKVVRAVARRRREVVLTLHGKAAVWVNRHLPALVRAVLKRASPWTGRPE